MLTCDDYLTPGSLDEAFDMMASNRGRHRIVAGATDTLPWAREGRAGDVHITTLIDVAKIPDLREISVGERRVRLGAATPIQRFLDDRILARALPAMPRCAVWFADDQIRAQATIGGNIVNASPAADATPCLIAHEAEVELAKYAGGKVTRRRMKLDQFVMGPNRTALADGELLVAIECDLAEAHCARICSARDSNADSPRYRSIQPDPWLLRPLSGGGRGTGAAFGRYLRRLGARWRLGPRAWPGYRPGRAQGSRARRHPLLPGTLAVDAGGAAGQAGAAA